MDWQRRATTFIADVHRSLPATATYDERRKALRAKSAEFALGTSWGKKVWPKRCREYLRRFDPKAHSAEMAKRIAGRDDILFPFRLGEPS